MKFFWNKWVRRRKKRNSASEKDEKESRRILEAYGIEAGQTKDCIAFTNLEMGGKQAFFSLNDAQRDYYKEKVAGIANQEELQSDKEFLELTALAFGCYSNKAKKHYSNCVACQSIFRESFVEAVKLASLSVSDLIDFTHKLLDDYENDNL